MGLDLKKDYNSAKSKISDIEKGLEVGADLYITKPFSTRNLLKSVNELLDIKP